MSHSVRRHLRVEIDEYDREVRRFVPGYGEMIRVAAECVAAAGQGLVIDLGAGTGALSEAILERWSSGSVELVDADSEMLERARVRLERFGDRVGLREASFDDPLPPCVGVAASLALHHVSAMDRKRILYRRIGEALRPGGVLVNADVAVPAPGEERDAVYRLWMDHMAAHGIDEAQAHRHFDEWAEEDTYFPVGEETAAMTDAGLDARCAWSLGPMTVLVGMRREP